MYGIGLYVVAFIGFAAGWATGLVSFALLAHRDRDEDDT